MSGDARLAGTRSIASVPGIQRHVCVCPEVDRWVRYGSIVSVWSSAVEHNGGPTVAHSGDDGQVPVLAYKFPEMI